MVRVVTLLATSVVIVAATSDPGGRFCVVLGIEELEEAVLRFPVLLIREDIYTFWRNGGAEQTKRIISKSKPKHVQYVWEAGTGWTAGGRALCFTHKYAAG
jgi:hypothetical protein